MFRTAGGAELPGVYGHACEAPACNQNPRVQGLAGHMKAGLTKVHDCAGEATSSEDTSQVSGLSQGMMLGRTKVHGCACEAASLETGCQAGPTGLTVGGVAFLR